MDSNIFLGHDYFTIKKALKIGCFKQSKFKIM
jgi:hypothetical protein